MKKIILIMTMLMASLVANAAKYPHSNVARENTELAAEYNLITAEERTTYIQLTYDTKNHTASKQEILKNAKNAEEFEALDKEWRAEHFEKYVIPMWQYYKDVIESKIFEHPELKWNTSDYDSYLPKDWKADQR